MDRWLLTFLLGAILSLFLPEVPALFQLFLIFLIAIGSFSVNSLRSSSGLWFGALCILTHSYCYHNQLPASFVELMETKQKFTVEGEVVSLISAPILTLEPNSSAMHKATINSSINKLAKTKTKTKPQSPPSLRFNFSVTKVNEQQLKSPILIRLSWKKVDFDFYQGSKIQLKVKLKPAHGLSNIGSFNYLTWLKANNIAATGYVISNKKVSNKKVINDGQVANKSVQKKLMQNRVIEQRKTYRQKMFEQYRQVILTTDTSLTMEQKLTPVLLALTFGDRTSLNKEHWKILQSTGTSHLIAISGLHIGLLAASVFYIVSIAFNYVPFRSEHWQQLNIKYVAIIASLLFATIYAYLAGFSLPTQRALIMLNLYWLSRLIGINLSLKRLLLIAVFLLLMISPFSLLTASFWLSFYAVAVIFITIWRFRSLLQSGGRLIRFFKGLMTIQLALTFMLLPISALSFQEISLIALFANIIAVPWMSFVCIPAALISLLLMPLSELVSQCFAVIALESISWLWGYLEFLSDSVNIYDLSFTQQKTLFVLGFIVFIYLYLLPFNQYAKPNKSRFSILKNMTFYQKIQLKSQVLSAKKRLVILIVVIISVFLIGHYFTLMYSYNANTEKTIGFGELSAKNKSTNEPGLNNALLVSSKIGDAVRLPWKVIFFDVGQGLSILIIRNGSGILYDTGASYPSGFNMSEAVILPYLQHIGLSKLDKVILSHSDNDHAGGLPQLIENVDVIEVITNDVDLVKNDKRFEPLINHTPIKTKPCTVNDSFTWQGLSFEVLWPDERKGAFQGLLKGEGLDNDDSCVLLITDEYDHRVLLTGDISAAIEAKLVKHNPRLSISVLQVPHHGSKTSSSELLLSHYKIDTAIVSAGFYNRWNMPVPPVVERYKKHGIKLYNNADVGQIEVTFNGPEFLIKTYSEDLKPFWYSY